MNQLARKMIDELIEKLGDIKIPDTAKLEVCDDIALTRQQRIGWFCYIRIKNKRYANCIDVDASDITLEEINTVEKEAHNLFEQHRISRKELGERDKKTIEELRHIIDAVRSLAEDGGHENSIRMMCKRALKEHEVSS